MTPASLLELRALADRATPAPWFARGRHISRVPNDSGMGATLHTNHIGVLHEADDAAFAAMARTAVPELLDRVEALEAEVARMRPIVKLLSQTDEDDWQNVKLYRAAAPMLFTASDGRALYLVEASKRALLGALVTK